MTECTFGFLYLNNSDGETEIKRKMELFSQKHNIGTVLNDQEIHNIIRDELPFYATPEIILKTLIDSLQDINSSIKEISYEGCFSSSSFSYEKYEIESGTALYWALNNQRWGSQSIVKYLLQRKADPNCYGFHAVRQRSPSRRRCPLPQSGERRERKRSLLLVIRSLAVISEFALNSC